MFNLIYKDVKLQRKTMMILLPALFLYLYLDFSSLYLGIFFSIAFAMNAFTNDDKKGIHVLLNSLPYTRKEIVSSKYAGTFVFTVVITNALMIGDYLFNRTIPLPEETFLVFMVVMFLMAFIFPVFYILKRQYIIPAGIALFAVYMLIITFINPYLHDQIREWMHTLLMLEKFELYGILFILVSLLYIGSWLLSVRVYSKKVF